MSLQCDRHDCGGATKLLDAEELENGRSAWLETYECEFGHRFREVVPL